MTAWHQEFEEKPHDNTPYACHTHTHVHMSTHSPHADCLFFWTQRQCAQAWSERPTARVLVPEERTVPGEVAA